MESVVSKLVSQVSIPKMFKVRQLFPCESISEKDIPKMIREKLSRPDLIEQIKPGMSIAITAGSRGIAHVALITKTIVDFVKDRQAYPFVMGEHLVRGREKY